MTQLWSIDLLVPVSGLFVGLLVGQTGMGGGALMTPILVLLFSMGLLVISMGALVGAVVLLALGHDRRLERAPGVQEHLRGA